MALPSPSESRTCIVTGASSGIGKEIARQLAGRGQGLTLVARREAVLKELAEELSSAHKVRVEVVGADLMDPSSRSALFTTITERGLTPEVLVNNAGFSTTGPVHQGERERELALVRTDVEAVVDLCTLALPGMVSRGRGAILNVASTAAFQPLPGQAAYGASKAFVLSYTRALRAELAGTGVSMTALCPGPVKTNFIETAGFTDKEAESSLPRFMWMPAESVARAAVDGLEHGRAVVIPGLSNRVAAYVSHLTPRDILVPIIARQHPALKR
jgi:short-subunit dehydrogenase